MEEHGEVVKHILVEAAASSQRSQAAMQLATASPRRRSRISPVGAWPAASFHKALMTEFQVGAVPSVGNNKVGKKHVTLHDIYGLQAHVAGM